MTDWLKQFQSVGRGLRTGEITILKSRQSGNSMIIDIESDFAGWKHVFCTHYVEMYSFDEGDFEWFAYPRKPSMSVMYEATKVIRKNEDGSFEYIKNRTGTGVKVLDREEEKEMTWIILKARNME